MMTLAECINCASALYPPDLEAEPDEQGFDEVVRLDQEDDGQIACVWCPYRFLHRGHLHHTGTNVFNPVKDRGEVSHQRGCGCCEDSVRWIWPRKRPLEARTYRCSENEPNIKSPSDNMLLQAF